MIIFFDAAKITVTSHSPFEELSSINCEIVSLRPTALLEVILYGDKKLNDKSNHQMLTVTINYIKKYNDLNRTYFKYLKVILSTR